MFIQGQHDIIGVDAYTGREMWDRHIEDIGRFPPAFRGGNIITDGDRVYCVKGLTCYALDAKTGKTVREYKHTLTPEEEEETKKLISLQGLLSQKVESGKSELRDPSVVWEFLGMAGNRIIGTLGLDAANLKHNGLAIPNQSRCIFAYDKTTGEKAWEIRLDKTVMPTAIVRDHRRKFSGLAPSHPLGQGLYCGAGYRNRRRRGIPFQLGFHSDNWNGASVDLFLRADRRNRAEDHGDGRENIPRRTALHGARAGAPRRPDLRRTDQRQKGPVAA